MAFEQNGQPLTEQQIRTMRGDLTASPVAEPQLQVPVKPVFDADEPAFTPTTNNQLPSSVDDLIAQEGKKKTLWWIVGGIGGAILLGAIGYFGIYPILSSPPSVPAEPVAATPPAEPAVPTTPAQPLPPTPIATPTFIKPTAGMAVIVLPATYGQQEISTALIKAGQTAANGLTALTITDEKGGVVSFAKLLTTVAPTTPDIAKANLLFAEETTSFIYKDKTGAWPGYVGALKPGFASADLRAWFSGLERGKLAPFFLVNPGAFAPFKTGVIGDTYQDRYAAGKTAGASFSYLMLPETNKVIVSTSFDGLKEAMRLMGL